jgi:hypothetical protein
MGHNLLKSLALGAGIAMSFATFANANTATINQAWEGHKNSEICYAISFPVKESANRESYLTVTNRFADRIRDEFGLVSGFDPTADIEGSIRIDDNNPVRMLVYKGTGYLKSKSTEQEVIRQMLKGKELEVKWTEPSGNYKVDKFSLFGFTAARNFTKACK